MRKKPISSRTKKTSKTYEKGFLKTIRNETGRKRNLYVSESESGYTAYYPTEKGEEHIVATTKSNPEKMAVNLSKKGHREVRFLD